MAADPLRMVNETMWFIPQNGVIPNTTHAGQVIPGFVIQPEMARQLVGQESGSHNNQTQQNSQVVALEKFLKAETKTLGVIQIMIGLIHIGFASVLAVLWPKYTSAVILIGYPFWGGLFFIGSGSLSVSAEKYLSHCWVKYTVGMNITSAVMALIGMMLFITEMILNPENDDSMLPRTLGIGLGVVLLLFSFLEFCVATSTANVGCKAACYSNDQAIVVVPCAVSEYGVAPAEVNPAPPAYNNVAPSRERLIHQETN